MKCAFENSVFLVAHVDTFGTHLCPRSGGAFVLLSLNKHLGIEHV